MNKLLKILIVAELIVLALATIFWALYKEDNPWAGLWFVYPLIGLVIITVTALISAFASGLKTSFSKTVTLPQLFMSVFGLVGVPLLGLGYSASGDNRQNLKIISLVALILGVLALAVILKRNLTLK